MPKSTRIFCTKTFEVFLLAETSGLTSSEFASVLAMSGTAGAEGESIGNSWKFSQLYHAGQNDYRYRSEIKSKTIGLYQITDVTDLY